jgi:hypothetical protein
MSRTKLCWRNTKKLSFDFIAGGVLATCIVLSTTIAVALIPTPEWFPRTPVGPDVLNEYCVSVRVGATETEMLFLTLFCDFKFCGGSGKSNQILLNFYFPQILYFF